MDDSFRPMLTGAPSATDADLARYRKAIGAKLSRRSDVFRRLRSIGFALRETRRYGHAVSRAYGVDLVAQILELAKAQFHVGLNAKDFYLHQYYLPERRRFWWRHVTAHSSQSTLIKRHGCPDFAILRDKIIFSKRAEMLGIPTIPVLATFVEGETLGSPLSAPCADLFSKPSSGWKGNGATLWRYEEGAYRRSGSTATALPWDGLLEYLRKRSKVRAFILQLAAHNHPGLRPLTNGALATVRIVTCLTPSGSIDLMPPALKMPWGAAVADNMAQGGLVAPVDPASGHIAGPAYRKDEKIGVIRVATHPDTGTSFTGLQIPFWREAVELSLAAHAAFDSMFFIGWDIAILDDGPVILEGNPLWDVDVILLAHRITVADTQFVPYWLHHYNVGLAHGLAQPR